MTKQERIDKALKLHGEGYNCAQCVLMATNDFTSEQADMAVRVAAGFGGGFGATGNICGVLSAIGMAEGLRGWNCPNDKGSVYGVVRSSKRDFEERYGTITCRELKAGKVACSQLIADGVTYLCDKYSIE